MLKAVVGLQFGDEGKGKFVDFLACDYQHIVRFNGGANAGHTVIVNGEHAAFSQIPATVTDGKFLYICQGALISMERMIQEINFIHSVCQNSKIYIDPRCHIVMPIHVQLNKASEAYKGEKKIGSVGVGVGACFEDKSNRVGIRLIDLIDEETLKDKLQTLWEIKDKQISNVFGGELTLCFYKELNRLSQLGKRLQPYFCFTNDLLKKLLDNGTDVLLESSQATFLDNSFGTYPYTVAYQTLIQSCFTSMGVPAEKLNVLGVMKSYMIRVGNGPLPTEINDEQALYIRKRGNEFGTVSNRPRRCAWLDLALIEHAIELNGVNEVSITNVDVLSNIQNLKVCVGYRLNGLEVCINEALLHFDHVEPIYEQFDSWPELYGTYYGIDDLPFNLIKYLSFIQSKISADIRYISYGPDRNKTLKINSGEFKAQVKTTMETIV